MYQNLMPLRFIHDYYYFDCVVLCFIEDSCFSKDLWLRIGKDSPENFPTKKKGFKTVVSEKFGRVLAWANCYYAMCNFPKVTWSGRHKITIRRTAANAC